MFDRSRSLAAWTAAAAALALAACTGSSSGGSTTADPPKYPGLASLSVEPADPSIPKGLGFQFAAIATFEDGSTSDVTGGVTWTSSDPSIAAFATDAGRGTTPGTGAVTVTASVDGIAGSTTLTVLDAAIVSLDVTPDAPTILIGTSLKLAATATLTDDTTVDIGLVSWSSSDASTVVVGSDGTVYAQALGSATITAVEPTTGLSASTLVSVTPIPGLLSYVSIKPGSVVGGSGRIVQGVVALTSPVAGGRTVTLASSNPDAANADPLVLTVAPTTQFATFAVDTFAVTRRAKVTISATADGDENAGVVKTATLNVRVAK